MAYLNSQEFDLKINLFFLITWVPVVTIIPALLDTFIIIWLIMKVILGWIHIFQRRNNLPDKIDN